MEAGRTVNPLSIDSEGSIPSPPIRFLRLSGTGHRPFKAEMRVQFPQES